MTMPPESLLLVLHGMSVQARLCFMHVRGVVAQYLRQATLSCAGMFALISAAVRTYFVASPCMLNACLAQSRVCMYDRKAGQVKQMQLSTVMSRSTAVCISTLCLHTPQRHIDVDVLWPQQSHCSARPSIGPKGAHIKSITSRKHTAHKRQLSCRHPQHSGMGTQQHPVQMTQRAQELFLAYAHFCGERGVEPLIPIIKQAVVDAVASLELATKLDADQVLQVLSDVHKRKTTGLHPSVASMSNCMSCAVSSTKLKLIGLFVYAWHDVPGLEKCQPWDSDGG